MIALNDLARHHAPLRSELDAAMARVQDRGLGTKCHCTVEGGMNSRMDELQAALLRGKLPRPDGWNRRRRAIAAHYGRAIRHPGIVLPAPAIADGDVARLFVARTAQRDARRAHLVAAGVATDVRYPIPDHRQPGAGSAPPSGLPRTERACAEVLSLPCYPEPTDAEIDAVATACNQWRPATRS